VPPESTGALASSSVVRTVTTRRHTAPSFLGLKPASDRASLLARRASIKRDTRCEIVLRSALWRLGFRYKVNVTSLPGRPDIVFPSRRVVVFCDGDFWHGRHLRRRLKRLAKGHNPQYWVAKVRRNVERDRKHRVELERAGWLVLRYWETDILRDPRRIADDAAMAIRSRSLDSV
jgi:DNA mismatch endonuclease, patch repair protein